jgi:hypothetical protein
MSEVQARVRAIFWNSVQFVEVAGYVFSTLGEHEELKGAVVEVMGAHRSLVENEGMREFLLSRPEVMLQLLEMGAR